MKTFSELFQFICLTDSPALCEQIFLGILDDFHSLSWGCRMSRRDRLRVLSLQVVKVYHAVFTKLARVEQKSKIRSTNGIYETKDFMLPRFGVCAHWKSDPLFFYNRNPHTFFIFRWKFWDSGFWRRIIKTEWPITRGSKLDFQRVMFCCVRPKSSIILCLITTDPREVINRCIPCTAQAHKNGANSHFTRTSIGIEYCVHLRVVGELN